MFKGGGGGKESSYFENVSKAISGGGGGGDLIEGGAGGLNSGFAIVGFVDDGMDEFRFSLFLLGTAYIGNSFEKRRFLAVSALVISGTSGLMLADDGYEKWDGSPCEYCVCFSFESLFVTSAVIFVPASSELSNDLIVTGIVPFIVDASGDCTMSSMF